MLVSAMMGMENLGRCYRPRMTVAPLPTRGPRGESAGRQATEPVMRCEHRDALRSSNVTALCVPTD